MLFKQSTSVPYSGSQTNSYRICTVGKMLLKIQTEFNDNANLGTTYAASWQCCPSRKWWLKTQKCTQPVAPGASPVCLMPLLQCHSKPQQTFTCSVSFRHGERINNVFYDSLCLSHWRAYSQPLNTFSELFRGFTLKLSCCSKKLSFFSFFTSQEVRPPPLHLQPQHQDRHTWNCSSLSVHSLL